MAPSTSYPLHADCLREQREAVGETTTAVVSPAEDRGASYLGQHCYGCFYAAWHADDWSAITGDWGDVAGGMLPAIAGDDVPGKPTPKRSNLSSPSDYSLLSGSSFARGFARVASTFATPSEFEAPAASTSPAFGANTKIPVGRFSTRASHYTPAVAHSPVAGGLSFGDSIKPSGSLTTASVESMLPPEDFLKSIDIDDDTDLSDAPGSGLKSDASSAPGSSKNPFSTVGVGGATACRVIKVSHGPGRRCLGKVGTVGKFCGEFESVCKFPTHKRNKLDPDLALLYCVNAKEQAMPTPTFTMEELIASDLWPDYRDQVLEHQGWMKFKQLLVHNAKAAEDEKVTRGQAVELVAGPMKVMPTTAKKRRFVADFQYAPTPTVEASERVNLLALGVAQSLSAIEEAVSDLNNCYFKIATLLGTPLDATTGLSTVYEWVDSLQISASGFEATIDTIKRKILSMEGDFASSRQDVINQVNMVTLKANNATATATRALEMASMAGAAGFSGKLGMLEQGFTAVQAAQHTQAIEMDGLFGAIHNLASRAAQGAPPAGGATAAEFAAFKSSVNDKIAEVKQSVTEGGPVTIGNLTFDGVQSCNAWLSKQNITGPIHQELLDVVSAICCVDGPTKQVEEFDREALMQQKTAKSTQSMRVALSFESQVPAILAGKAKPTEGLLTHQSHFGNIENWRHWDAGDGMGGMSNWLKQGWRVLERTSAQQVLTLYGQTNPEFVLFINTLRQEAGSQLMELCDEVASMHSNLLHLSYGQKNWTESERKETWSYVLVFLDVYFSEQFKKRSLAKNLNGYVSPLVSNAVAMWATIQSIDEMTRLLDHVGRLEAKVGRVQAQCGTPDDGGAIGGGVAAIGAKRNKRNAKKALEKAAEGA
eukprot:scaffold2314_cov55-Cyclotella_meneghiniana.AAC.2